MDFDTENIYYHGTNKDFEEFEFNDSYREGFLGSLNKVKCEAFFFIKNKATAGVFAENRAEHFGGEANIKECYLSFNKTLDLTGGLKYERYVNKDELCWDTRDELVICNREVGKEELSLMNNNAAYQKLSGILGVDLVEEGAADYDMIPVKKSRDRKQYKYDSEELLLLLDNPQIIKNIKKSGYDSVLCQEQKFEGRELGESIAVLSSQQIIETKNYKPEKKKVIKRKSKSRNSLR